MSSQSSTRGVGAFSYSDYERVWRVKYTELRTFSLSEQETRQPLDYYTGDSNSNDDKQWECTRAMACIAPTMTPARRRTIRSTGESANRKSASQEQDTLIFFSSL